MISNKNGDCFAFDKRYKKCRALNALYCTNEICEFYKTKEQFIKENMLEALNGKEQSTY